MSDAEFILRSALAQRDKEIERLRAALEQIAQGAPEQDSVPSGTWYTICHQLGRIAREALRPADETAAIADRVYAMSPHIGDDCKVCNDGEVK